MQTTLRWCKDIKMWAIDRPINDVGDVNGSCVHRTSFVIRLVTMSSYTKCLRVWQRKILQTRSSGSLYRQIKMTIKIV